LTGRQGIVYHDAGVSESIGFLLIFTIIIAGIGLVTLYGYPMLLRQQMSADEQIMEKNMIVLQNDVKSLAYKTVPYKETSLKVGGGSLTLYNSSSSPDLSRITISGTGTITTTGKPLPVMYPTGDLRYESTGAGSMISLENGAVVLRKLAQPGSTMLAEPRWFYDAQTNTAVITLIRFNSTGVMGRYGVGTVQMALGETNYTEYDISGGTVSVHYEPDTGADYSTAWSNYFTNTLGMIPDGEGGYRFATTPSKLVIKEYEIMVKSL
jgi:hypothetical protein